MTTEIADLLPSELTPVGEVKAAEPLAKPEGFGLNRHQRRASEAFEKSAKWKRMFNNSHKAAVRKLNRLAAEARARAAMPDPLD